MINVTIYRDQNENYVGFDCIGHAGYADAGEDVVCAGVSALVINTINSIATLVKDKCHVDTQEETGRICFRFDGVAQEHSVLLISSMILGLQGIQNNYGNEYMMLDFKEV